MRIKWDNDFAQQMLATESAGMNVTWYFILGYNEKSYNNFLMTYPLLPHSMLSQKVFLSQSCLSAF